MVGFTLSCVGAARVPVARPSAARSRCAPRATASRSAFKEASLLVKEADVRMAGLTVGKVKDKRLDAKNGITIAELEIEEKYAPIPRDTRALLRIKALLARPTWSSRPVTGSRANLADGGTAADRGGGGGGGDRRDHLALRQGDARQLPGLDPRAGDARSTRAAGRTSTTRSATCRGSWPAPTTCSRCSTSRSPRCARWCATPAARSNAVNERRGQLRELIGNANDTFGALASRNESLAEAILIFPTFLDESRATFAPAQDASRTTPGRSCATSSRWRGTCGPPCATWAGSRPTSRRCSATSTR